MKDTGDNQHFGTGNAWDIKGNGKGIIIFITFLLLTLLLKTVHHEGKPAAVVYGGPEERMRTRGRRRPPSAETKAADLSPKIVELTARIMRPY